MIEGSNVVDGENMENNNSNSSCFSWMKIFVKVLIVVSAVGGSVVSIWYSREKYISNATILSSSMNITTTAAGNNISHAPLYPPYPCVTVHGQILQPYWVLLVKTLGMQVFSSLLAYILRRYFSSETSNKLASPLTGRVIRFFNLMQIISFVFVIFSLNYYYAPSYAPSAASQPTASIGSVVGNNTTNTTSSIYNLPDVTWLPHHLQVSAPSAWRLYEQVYMKYLGSGASAFFLAGYNGIITTKVEIDVTHAAYLSYLLTCKIGIVVVFILPPLLTHVLPTVIMYPHFTVALAVFVRSFNTLINFILRKVYMFILFIYIPNFIMYINI